MKCKRCENEAKPRYGDICSEQCRFYDVSMWSSEELIEELSRPSVFSVDPFAFHVLKHAIKRLLEEIK